MREYLNTIIFRLKLLKLKTRFSPLSSKSRLGVLVLLSLGIIPMVILVQQSQELRRKALTNPVGLIFVPNNVTLDLSQNKQSTIALQVEPNGNRVGALEVTLRVTDATVARIKSVTLHPSNTFTPAELPQGEGIRFNDSQATVRLGALCTQSSRSGCSSTNADYSVVSITLEALKSGTIGINVSSVSQVAAIGITGDASSGGLKGSGIVTVVSNANTSTPRPTTTPALNVEKIVTPTKSGTSVPKPTGAESGSITLTPTKVPTLTKIPTKIPTKTPTSGGETIITTTPPPGEH